MFTLVIDKTRSHLLQMIFNESMSELKENSPLAKAILRIDRENGNSEYATELLALVTEFTDKVHEHDFCIDKDCKFGNEN